MDAYTTYFQSRFGTAVSVTLKHIIAKCTNNNYLKEIDPLGGNFSNTKLRENSGRDDVQQYIVGGAVQKFRLQKNPAHTTHLHYFGNETMILAVEPEAERGLF